MHVSQHALSPSFSTPPRRFYWQTPSHSQFHVPHVQVQTISAYHASLTVSDTASKYKWLFNFIFDILFFRVMAHIHQTILSNLSSLRILSVFIAHDSLLAPYTIHTNFKHSSLLVRAIIIQIAYSCNFDRDKIVIFNFVIFPESWILRDTMPMLGFIFHQLDVKYSKVQSIKQQQMLKLSPNKTRAVASMISNHSPDELLVPEAGTFF